MGRGENTMSYADRLDTDIETFLKRHEQKELLRFVTLGSVDDGKSTLIGRLLHDVDGVYEDQLDDARQNGAGEDGEIDFALITDGLVAEREQGITIDVAYRYFTTQKRKFIIADSPGHVQYTRNMATGASTAEVAIILIDARHGVLQQSRRHAYIASLLGIPHLVVCINKMDAMDYSEETYRAIEADFAAFAKQLRFSTVTPLPVSALKGDNVVTASDKMPWHDGNTLLNLLETLDLGSARNMTDFRYPVQYVIRPNQNYRGYAGQVVSGVVRKGDEVTVMPGGTRSRVSKIDTYSGELEEAFAPMSVSICLEDELDISRGDVLVHGDSKIHLARTFDAMMVWMAETPLDPAKSYLIKHTARYVRAGFHQVKWRLNMDTLAEEQSASLSLNEIGRVQVTAHQALVFDAYADNRGAGCFVVVDSLTNNTVAAGMIVAPDQDAGDHQEKDEALIGGLRSGVSPLEREEQMGQKGSTLWISGVDGEEKTRFVYALERRLFDQGTVVHVMNPLDPENAAYGVPLSNALEMANICNHGGMVTLFAVPHAAETAIDSARDHMTGSTLVHVELGVAVSSGANVALDVNGVGEKESIERLVSYLMDQGILHRADRGN